jgi:hypothetical protein
MTQAVSHILGEFEQLSDAERKELRRAIVERVPMSDDLTDDDFAARAAASFRALDEAWQGSGFYLRRRRGSVTVGLRL